MSGNNATVLAIGIALFVLPRPAFIVIPLDLAISGARVPLCPSTSTTRKARCDFGLPDGARPLSTIILTQATAPRSLFVAEFGAGSVC